MRSNQQLYAKEIKQSRSKMWKQKERHKNRFDTLNFKKYEHSKV